MAYRHALLALDLRDKIDRLLDRAAMLIEQGVQLDVISVMDPFDLYYQLEPSLGRLSRDFEDAVLSRARSALETAAAPLGLPSGSVHLVQGHRARVIVDFAEAVGCDLIVIGTHERQGLSRLLGATSYAVLHRARCDVLTVPLVAPASD